MQGLTLIPQHVSLDFVKNRSLSLGISAIFIVLSLFMCGVRGLNLGIDFVGGFIVEVRSSTKTDTGILRNTLNQLNLGQPLLQTIDDQNSIVMRFEKQSGGDAAQSAAVDKIKAALGKNYEIRRIDVVGPTFSADLIHNGIVAFSLALLAMLVYVWLRFEWQFGICAVIALIHDGIAIFGFYAFSQYEFNESVIIALLTTIGYSINDTVVIYDRIRENMCKFKKRLLTDNINISVNETLSRTIFTSGTTLIALFALYFFGGSVIENFALPIIIGVIFGTYSSICVASVLLTFFNGVIIEHAGNKGQERC